MRQTYNVWTTEYINILRPYTISVWLAEVSKQIIMNHSQPGQPPRHTAETNAIIHNVNPDLEFVLGAAGELRHYHRGNRTRYCSGHVCLFYVCSAPAAGHDSVNTSAIAHIKATASGTSYSQSCLHPTHERCIPTLLQSPARTSYEFMACRERHCHPSSPTWQSNNSRGTGKLR